MNAVADLWMAVAQGPLVSIGYPGTHANVLPDSKVMVGLDANRPKFERVRKFCIFFFQSDFNDIGGFPGTKWTMKLTRNICLKWTIHQRNAWTTYVITLKTRPTQYFVDRSNSVENMKFSPTETGPLKTFGRRGTSFALEPHLEVDMYLL